MGSPTDRDPPVDHDRRWSATVERETLVLESSGPDGDLASSPACRAAAVDALQNRSVERVVVRRHGLEYRYDDYTAAVLVAAGRFADLVADRDPRLATLTRRDPLAAAREATARGGAIADVAAESGLTLLAERVADHNAPGSAEVTEGQPSITIPFFPTPLCRRMFYAQRTTVPDSAAELRAEYDDQLAAIVEETGLEETATATAVDEGTLERLVEGDLPSLAFTEAAELVALVDGEPDAETVVEIACDHLLLGMSMAVLDVEAVESELELDLDAKEIQQKIERRAPMSFEEYVHLQHAIVSRMP